MKRLLLCAALLAWSAMASAVVYKWTDAQGKTQYGDRPPDGVHAEVVELLGTHSTRPSPATQAPGSPADAPPGGVSAQDKKAVDEDVQAARAKQCSEAQDRYKRLIEGRRLYKTGDDGEKQFLTSEEIDTARLNAKHDIDLACNATS